MMLLLYAMVILELSAARVLFEVPIESRIAAPPKSKTRYKLLFILTS
jgi:hypothetical protein